MTYCVTTNIIKFGNDVKIIFPPGQLKKNNEKLKKKKKNNKSPSND